jgi:uncharacterized protein YbaR (Trm112 family)
MRERLPENGETGRGLGRESDFICPVTGRRLYEEEDRLVTGDGVSYPILDGIPLLVPEPGKHLERIRALAGSERGDWYSRPQVDYYDRGPYRHHLNRRRRLVEAWVRRCCENSQAAGGNPILRVLDLGCGDEIGRAHV